VRRGQVAWATLRVGRKSGFKKVNVERGMWPVGKKVGSKSNRRISLRGRAIIGVTTRGNVSRDLT